MKRLEKFFMEEFRELYRSEKRWLIILPEVARNMSPAEVEQAVIRHLEQTAARVIRLEEIFQLMAVANRQESQLIRPLLREASAVLAAVTRSTTAVRKQAIVQPSTLRGVGGVARLRHQN